MAKLAMKIKNLQVGIDDKLILQGVNLEVKTGELVAIMGPNGSGKSTLAQVIAGSPFYQVKSGQILWRGRNILKLKPEERARLGLFLAWQYPVELPGVNLYDFLLTAYQAVQGKKRVERSEFDQLLQQALLDLRLSEKFLQRSVNEGFSGGEKKKTEILQLEILRPKLAVLDETDSGLDIDALRVIADNIRSLLRQGMGFLVITHYQRLLRYLRPDKVKVMLHGRIVKSGDAKLARQLERKGYQWLVKEYVKAD